MICPRCGSTNVSAQVINEVHLKKKHSLFYWLFIGWWLNPFLWLVVTLPMLFIHLFKPKNYATVNTSKTMWVCQNCGNMWTARPMHDAAVARKQQAVIEAPQQAPALPEAPVVVAAPVVATVAEAEPAISAEEAARQRLMAKYGKSAS